MISPVKIWRRQKQIREILGRKGKVIAWTKIYIAPKEFKKLSPYFVVLVELENKIKVVGQLVDCQEKDIKVGNEVVAVLRRVKEVEEEDIIPYGVKFVVC